jgi:hypothetical protein
MAAVWPGGSGANEPNGYSIVARVPGSGGAWDYAVVDSPGGRLFLAQAGVTALDLRMNTVTTGLVAGKTTHGVALVGAGTVAVDDSQSKTITIFDGVSGRVLSAIPTAERNPVSGIHALDAMVLEPKTGVLVALNGESGLALLVDVGKSSVVGSVSIGGHTEFAAADAAGTVYINVNRSNRSELAALDVAGRRVVGYFVLPGCGQATGLAYDQPDRLVLSVCDNGVLQAFDAAAGHVVGSIAVGRGADAVMFDGVRRRAFVAGGEDGTLSVIAVRSSRDIALVQTLNTQAGTRLGAVDVGTGRVYLPSAKFGPPRAPIPYPAVLPGSFEFIVVVPN